MRSVLRRAWWLIPALVLAAGLFRLRFDTEVLNLLPAASPAVAGLRLNQTHFPGSEDLILTLQGTDATTLEAAAETIASHLTRATNLIRHVEWQPPWMTHPESLAELIAGIWLNQPPEAWRELVSRIGAGGRGATLAATREQLASTLSPLEIARLGADPFELSRLPPAAGGTDLSLAASQAPFASADGRFRVMFIKPAVSGMNYRAQARWLTAVQHLVDEARDGLPAGTLGAVGWTGRPAFVVSMSQSMERDLEGTVLGTALTIAGLFWLAHRRWRPLLWLIVLLGVVVAGTLALGGWMFGTLNVLGLGFGAILLGLAVDYALVLYQEARTSPGRTPREIRRDLAPSILWSALTTAGAFSALILAPLPGLAQLGGLVAGGSLLAAVVMLYGYLPVACRGGTGTPEGTVVPAKSSPSRGVPTMHWRWTAALFLTAITVIAWRPPRLDPAIGALVPMDSPPYRALAELNQLIERNEEATLLIIPGTSVSQVSERLRRAEDTLTNSRNHGTVASFKLPAALWPAPELQARSLPLAAELARAGPALRQAALEAGFTANALRLTDAILGAWSRAAREEAPAWPAGATASWLLDQCAARTPTGYVARGSVQLREAAPGAITALQEDLARDGILMAGWTLLGEDLLGRMEHRLPWILGLTGLLVLGSLRLAFRHARETFLSVLSLVVSLVLLLAVMAVAGWSWNLVNLTALPLLCGAGVDYSIHLLLSLQRHVGDLAAVRRATGRALLLCAATTAAGFGSLVWTGHPGLAALGRVAAAGIVCIAFTAMVLLPGWWIALASRKNIGTTPPPTGARPSGLYRGAIWHWGLRLGRWIPAGLAGATAAGIAGCYARCRPGRRRIVEDNLLPVCGGDRIAARRAAGRLFRQFGRKVAGLLRLEGGAPVSERVTEWSGLEHLDAARRSGRGILLVTPHLGDWEIGGRLLADRGLPLAVLTQAEPDERLTEVRRVARAQTGIDTIVVGTDPFAFVDVIHRLRNGGIVALLVDRPLPGTGAPVAFFGRTMAVSLAPAELARAADCVVLPVYVVRTAHGCGAHVLPPVAHDRSELGTREQRAAFAGEILRAFAPAITQHPDQWFHFVPLWPPS